MYDEPVDIEVVVFFKNRPMDSDNICDKFYIDALKHHLIAEDDRRFVRRVTVESRVDKENPRTVMTITPHKPKDYGHTDSRTD
jgi:Holliday junction resolvase RusA-like endonuclease